MSDHSPAEATPATLVTDKFVGEKECRQITNLSRVTRWRLMKQQLFPKKIRLSPNRTVWRLSDVLKWMSEREVA